MSVYVVSDLHGEAHLFQKLLSQIHFSDEDHMYILGDVIDRGSDGIALLQEIMDNPNMTLLLGNHEYMLLQYFSPEATETDIRRWNKNGNTPTRDAYLKLEPAEQVRILEYIQSLPTHMKVTVGRKVYYLVHGFPGENVHDQVWHRPAMTDPNPIPNTTLIIGHTPVLSMQEEKENREHRMAEMIRMGERPTILHTPGFIDIDCGCSLEAPLKTLGCLCLDDMAEFYAVSQENRGTVSS